MDLGGDGHSVCTAVNDDSGLGRSDMFQLLCAAPAVQRSHKTRPSLELSPPDHPKWHPWEASRSLNLASRGEAGEDQAE